MAWSHIWAGFFESALCKMYIKYGLSTVIVNLSCHRPLYHILEIPGSSYRCVLQNVLSSTDHPCLLRYRVLNARITQKDLVLFHFITAAMMILYLISSFVRSVGHQLYWFLAPFAFSSAEVRQT